MDGTSKGGIILSIRDQLALPVKFIGLGEKMDDLEEFDLDKYLYGLLIGEQEKKHEHFYFYYYLSTLEHDRFFCYSIACFQLLFS